MKDEKTVEEALQFECLRGAQFQMRHDCPILFRQHRDQLLRSRREMRVAKVRLQPELTE